MAILNLGPKPAVDWRIDLGRRLCFDDFAVMAEGIDIYLFYLFYLFPIGMILLAVIAR
jgi:hypothetical protein